MIAAVQDAVKNLFTAAAVSNGMLPTVRSVHFEEKQSLGHDQHPALFVVFQTSLFGVNPYKLEARLEFQLEVHGVSMKSLDQAERDVAEVIWSTNGNKGIIPMLKTQPGLTVGGVQFKIAVPELRFARGKDGTAYAALSQAMLVVETWT